MSLFTRLQQAIAAEQPVALATVIKGAQGVGSKLLIYERGEAEGDLRPPGLQAQIVADGRALLLQGQTGTKSYQDPDAGEVEVFFDVHPAPPTVFIFGGVHVGVSLCHLARDLGFRVRVIDARGKFASPERFQDADEIVIAHADDYLNEHPLGSSSYVAVLTHDPKLDDPALLHALRSDARYVGAIGSRKTNAARVERLRERGLTEEQLGRLHGGPVGMDIAAQSPEEIALSILAQMVAAKNGVATLAGKARAREGERALAT